jgi:hypothetical protein
MSMSDAQKLSQSTRPYLVRRAAKSEARGDVALAEVAKSRVIEACARISEGEVYLTRYRKWPGVKSRIAHGELEEDDPTTRHCDAIAAAIRATAKTVAPGPVPSWRQCAERMELAESLLRADAKLHFRGGDIAGEKDTLYEAALYAKLAALARRQDQWERALA